MAQHINDLITKQTDAQSDRNELVEGLVDHLYKFKPFNGMDESVLRASAEVTVDTLAATEVARIGMEETARKNEERAAEQLEKERDKRSAGEIAAS